MNIGTWAIHRLVSMYGSAHPLCLCLATPLPRWDLPAVLVGAQLGVKTPSPIHEGAPRHIYFLHTRTWCSSLTKGQTSNTHNLQPHTHTHKNNLQHTKRFTGLKFHVTDSKQIRVSTSNNRARTVFIEQ